MNIEEYESLLALHQVPLTELRTMYSEENFLFETTSDIDCIPNQMIGQQRAEHAMEFGLSVEQSGYNLFVVGPAGTGKMT